MRIRKSASRKPAPAPSSPTCWRPGASPDNYRAMIRRGNCLSATVSDEVIGFAAAGRCGRELHLHELSVARAHQGKGIGATLLRALAIDARNCGLRAITLNTFRDIAWNAPFYARQGFVEIENFEGREHLRDSHDAAVDLGMPGDRRCAMIKFLD
ncbi:GNAT family N-acetyltransferase [Altererythrobacter oceanensis]|uniref:GNAT family N-acetyltransferase n=2 Tax=Qipengyuania oceanensis TaxID=1463597 RepID=A0A844YJK1_9SPHN|nr:GNAT family N-acetyltransferase [Qipengyuania oceanensis]